MYYTRHYTWAPHMGLLNQAPARYCPCGACGRRTMNKIKRVGVLTGGDDCPGLSMSDQAGPDGRESTGLSGAGAPAALGRWHWWSLALVTMLGGILRFICLGRPVLWGDECGTYRRVCGTFEELLSHLLNDGFVPLHYELYWVLKQVMDLTPWQMRLAPAVAGTLMIPAMYLLGRQIVRPGTALLAATLTAFSAYFLTYSRDAKMYMEFWLMLTLHAGAMLWWMRSGKAVAWWCWVAAGAAAVGLHSAGWLIVGVEGIYLLATAGLRWKRLLAWALGLAIVAAGPVGYYSQFNRWATQSGGLTPTTDASTSWDRSSGIPWIKLLLEKKTGPELVRDSVSAYLIGYSQAEETLEPGGAAPIPSWVRHLAYGTVTFLIAMALVGAITPRRDGPGGTIPSPITPSRRLLLLGLWLVLPSYGMFYCRSMREFVSPWYWVEQAGGALGWHWLWAIPATFVLMVAGTRVRRGGEACATLAALLMGGAFAWSVGTWGATWYQDWISVMTAGWLPAVILTLAISAAWASSGDTFLQRCWAGGKFMAIVLTVLLLCGAASWGWHRVLAGTAEWKPIWMPRYLAVVAPAMLIAVAALFHRLPWGSLRVLAVGLFILVNLAQFSARLVLDVEPRVDLMAADVVGATGNPGRMALFADQPITPAPGAGSIWAPVGPYFLAQKAREAGLPAEVQQRAAAGSLPISRYGDVRRLADEVARRPNLQQIIIWQREGTQRRRFEGPSATLAALHVTWRLESVQTQDLRRFWNWQELDTYHRWVFTRSPTTRPTTDAP